MSWSNAFFLTLVLLACVYVMARIERGRWFMGLLFFVLPVVALTLAWAGLTGSWPEALTALGASLVIGGGWWLAVGRRLPRADSSAIKVWGQDTAPKPRATLQAELDQVTREKEQLEAELRRLKGEKNNGREA
jgi:hypothetical protein